MKQLKPEEWAMSSQLMTMVLVFGLLTLVLLIRMAGMFCVYTTLAINCFGEIVFMIFFP